MVRKKRALFQSEIINFLFRLIPTFVGALYFLISFLEAMVRLIHPLRLIIL
jgi:hypothetical protein